MNYYRYLLNKNKFVQTIAINALNGDTLTDLKFPVKKIKSISTIPLSELNLTKAHRRILLRSLSCNSDFSNKTETDFTVTSSATNRRKVYELLARLQVFNRSELLQQESNKFSTVISNILLKLKHLDLHKVNTKALSDISIELELQKKQRIILNEIFRIQR